MMRSTLWILAAVLACVVAEEKKIVCHYVSWTHYLSPEESMAISDIDPTLCTHILYGYIGLDRRYYGINVLDPPGDLPHEGGKDGFNKFVRLREKNPSVKLLFTIGGWSEKPWLYSIVAADPVKREAFVRAAVKFVKGYEFDGLDFDWEYPDDKQNFVLLLKELREKFDQEGLLLTAAVGASKERVDKSYDVAGISQYLDFINLMAYDFDTTDDGRVTSLSAPLSKVKHSVNYWLSQGAPREKLILGMSLHGYGFKLANAQNTKVGAPVSDPYSKNTTYIMSYNKLCHVFKQEPGSWSLHEEDGSPYAVKGNQWINFNNEKSIKEKSDLVNSMGLGGVMAYSIDVDDFRGECGEPLLKTINSVLKGGAAY